MHMYSQSHPQEGHWGGEKAGRVWHQRAAEQAGLSVCQDVSYVYLNFGQWPPVRRHPSGGNPPVPSE